jgi:putative peptidoglycan lipid II flippase
LKYAIIHVALATILGYLCAIPLPAIIGIEAKWGVVGLTASASVAAWVEFFLLRMKLNRRIGHTGLPGSFLAKLWFAALLAGGIGWAFKWALGPLHPVLLAVAVLGSYGVTYFVVTYALGVAESGIVTRRIFRVLRLSR